MTYALWLVNLDMVTICTNTETGDILNNVFLQLTDAQYVYIENICINL